MTIGNHILNINVLTHCVISVLMELKFAFEENGQRWAVRHMHNKTSA